MGKVVEFPKKGPDAPRAPKKAPSKRTRQAHNQKLGILSPATAKQHRYIAYLYRRMGWCQQQFERWAEKSFRIARVHTTHEASKVIEGLKALNAQTFGKVQE
jgi:hypothetical protein